MDGRKFSDEDLAQLTEEEREGLLEDEEEGGDDTEGGDDEEAGAATEGEAEASAEAGGDEAGDDEADGEADAGTTGSDEPVKPDATAAADAADEEPLPNDVAPSWILPADHDAKIAEIKAQRTELAQKWDNGEMTAQEFNAQIDALDDQRRELDAQKIAATIEQRAAINEWRGTVSRFVEEHPQYKPGSLPHKLLDEEVKRLQAEAKNPTNPALLERAHRNIERQIKTAYGVEPAPAKDDSGKPGAKPAGKAGNRPEPPPTLRSMPATDITDADDGSEFGYLDRLMDTDSVAFEKELAKLEKTSPAKYDAYMQRG